jgi:hypothetical protein
MTTVQQVFDMAIHLMDEQSESNGKTQITDTNEYRYRTISILNALLPQLYPYTDSADRSEPGRPKIPALKTPEEYSKPDFTQQVPVDDSLALGVLPYGLAAHLLASENGELSAWFMQRFMQNFIELRNFMPASFEPITAPYGLF